MKSEPDTEIAVVNAGVLGDENDIDVLKVNHHGSDTSTGDAFVNALDPEVAIMSSQLGGHGLPKLVAIKQLVENQALVYITGDGTDDHGTFTQSAHAEDNGFQVPAGTVINDAGHIHIFVSADGTAYSVVNGNTFRDFSAIDSDNARN